MSRIFLDKTCVGIRLTILRLWWNGFDLDRSGGGMKGCGNFCDLTGHWSQRFPFYSQVSTAIVGAAVLSIPRRDNR